MLQVSSGAGGGVIDSQSVKAPTDIPLTSHGIDPGKKAVGRKRNILTDSIGLLLAVIVSVTAASVQDHTTTAHPTVRKAWVDGGYRQLSVEHGAELGIDVEVVRVKTPACPPGTSLPPRRILC